MMGDVERSTKPLSVVASILSVAISSSSSCASISDGCTKIVDRAALQAVERTLPIGQTMVLGRPFAVEPSCNSRSKSSDRRPWCTRSTRQSIAPAACLTRALGWNPNQIRGEATLLLAGGARRATPCWCRGEPYVRPRAFSLLAPSPQPTSAANGFGVCEVEARTPGIGSGPAR